MPGMFDEDVSGTPIYDPVPPDVQPVPQVPVQAFDPTLRRVPVATPAAAPPPANLFDEDVGGPPLPKPLPGPMDVAGYRARYGELRPADLSPTERVIGAGQDALMGFSQALGGTPDPYHARKLAEGAVTLGGFTPMGSILSAADAGYNALRGKYGKAAIDAIGTIPGVMMIKRGIQAAKGALPMIRTAPTPTSAIDPVTGKLDDELQKSAKAAYDRVGNAPIVFHPNTMDDFTNRASSILQSPGGGSFTPENAPGVHGTFERWKAAFADGSRAVTPKDFDVLRGQLRAFDTGPDSAAGQRASVILDRYLSSPPPGSVVYAAPGALDNVQRDLAAARGDYRAFKTAGTVAQEIDTAGTKAGRAHSGLNVDNTTRQRLDALVTPDLYGNVKLFGATYPERQAINAVTQGDPTTNKFRYWSNRMGGGGGFTGTFGGGIAGHTVNSLLGSWGVDPITATGAGMAAGYVVPKVAEAARGVANERTVKAAKDVVDQIRRNSPLYKAREATSPDIPDPFAMQRDAIAYALLPKARQELQSEWDTTHVPYEDRGR